MQQRSDAMRYLPTMTSATVGLVMAAYNSSQFVVRSLETVLNQDFTDFTCCVVDDGSTDGTGDLARAFVASDSRFSVIEQDHLGASAARNLGVSELPATKYLGFPDSDDEWRVDALRALVDAADLLGGVGAHGLADEIDATGASIRPGVAAQYRRERFVAGFIRRHAVPIDSPSTFVSLVQSCTLFPPGSVLTRRDVFEQLGGFDPSLWQFEDWDLYIRASRHGDYAFVNKVVVDYRRHPGQTVNNPWVRQMQEVVGARALTSTLNSPLQRKAAMLAWRSSEFRRAVGMGRAALQQLKQRKFKGAVVAIGDVPTQLLRGIAGPVGVRIPARRRTFETTTE